MTSAGTPERIWVHQRYLELSTPRPLQQPEISLQLLHTPRKRPNPDYIFAYHGNLQEKFVGNTPHPNKLEASCPLEDPVPIYYPHHLIHVPQTRVKLDFSDEGILRGGRPYDANRTVVVPPQYRLHVEES